MRITGRASALTLLALLAGPAAAGEVAVVTSDGVTLSVSDQGQGEPVLLLHGLAASADLNWRAPGIIRALLGQGYRVIAPDARGHGGSSSPADGVYGARLVADAVAVLDALGVQRAHVVGYSMGGMTGLALTARHPERVRSLVLGGMGWMRPGSRGQSLWTRLPGRGRGGPVGCAGTLGELALSEELVRGVMVPVTVIVGSLDPCRPLYVRPLQELRPDWPVHLVEGRGHLACVAAPELREGILAALEAARLY